MRSKVFFLGMAACALCVACGKSEDAEAPIKAFPHATERAAPDVDMTSGAIDPKQVGVWKNATDTYTFRKDGSFELAWDRMMTVRPGQQERKTGGAKGKWVISGDNILMQSDDGTKFKLARVLSDSDNTLELHALYVKHGPTYKRVISSSNNLSSGKKSMSSAKTQ